MRTSEQIDALASALAKAQPRFGQIRRTKTVKVRTKTGGEYTFSYAPLEAVIDAVRVPLAEVGLSLIHPVETTETHVHAGAMLLHSSGQWIEDMIAVPRPPAMQELGSILTYLKRYCTQGVLGVQADDDDDGNLADGNHVTDKTRPVAPRREQARREADAMREGYIEGKKEATERAASDAAKGVGPKSQKEPSQAVQEKVKAENIAKLDAAAAAAFQPGDPLPIDDRQDDPRRDAASKRAIGIAKAQSMVEVWQAKGIRERIVANQADGLITEDDARAIEAAIVARVAELAGLMPGTEVKQPAKKSRLTEPAAAG